MDGAEGLEGVYVLAATSRPDLIDPALLRPGRLDKSILCDMPTIDERIDIVKKISENIKLDSSIQSYYIADRTQGFTGADLQALLYSAQLHAINDHLSVSTQSINNTETPESQIKSIIIQGAISSETVQKNLSLLIGNEMNLIDEKTETVTVGLEHLERALRETKPSLWTNEHQKLLKIYNMFSGGNAQDQKVGTKASFA
jgi:peroxin-1